METETGSNRRTKNINNYGQKRSGHGQRKNYPTNQNDYNDMQTKQRSLKSQGKKHRGRLGKRKNYPKIGSVNNFKKHSKHKSYSQNHLINSKKKHRRSFGKRNNKPKNGSINNDYTEFGFDYNNGWISK